MTSENNNQRDDHSAGYYPDQREDHSVDYFTNQPDDNPVDNFADQPDDNPVDNFDDQPDDNPIKSSTKNPTPVISDESVSGRSVSPPAGNGGNKNKSSNTKKIIASIAAIFLLAIIICTAYYFGTMKSGKEDIAQNDITAETSYNYEENISSDFTESNHESDLIANEENSVTDTPENNDKQTVPVMQSPLATDKITKATTARKIIRKITFDANGGSPSSSTKEVTEGEAIGFFPSVSKNGYYLDGWYTDPNGGTRISEETKAPSSDRTYYAHWTKSTYELSFNANGGSGAPASQSGNTTYTIPSTKPSRSGYTFLGWAKFSTSFSASYQPGDSITITSDTALYAVWEAETYKLTYNANGGSNPPSAQSGSAKYFISSTEPTRPGHTFLGWSESSSASSPSYRWGNFIEISSDTTLYAVWKVNSYTVSWKTGTGYSVSVKRTDSPYAGAVSGSLSNGDKIYYGDTLSVAYAASTGYSLTSKGSTNITVNGNVDSTVIYATAEAKECTYNIVYKSSNGTNLGSSTATNKFGTTNTISAPSKSGYDTPSSQSVKWDAESKTVTFVYTPKSVSATVKTGKVDDSETTQTYKVTVEHRNRTANSVQIRITYEQTIKAYDYSPYEYIVKLIVGGKESKKTVVPWGEWGENKDTSKARSRSVKTDWITVSGLSANTQAVNVKVLQWMENYHGTNLGEGVNISFKANIPVY